MRGTPWPRSPSTSGHKGRRPPRSGSGCRRWRRRVWQIGPAPGEPVRPDLRAAAPTKADLNPPVSTVIRTQRVYERKQVPGRSVLVDRVWPRGITKTELGDVLWLREVGPSDELRRWFGHRPDRWQEFRRRYRAELERPEQQEILAQLVAMARAGPVTLLYGARDTERNQAVVIREVLEERLRS